MSDNRERAHSLQPSAIATLGIICIGAGVWAARGPMIAGLSTGIALIGFSLLCFWSYESDFWYRADSYSPRFWHNPWKYAGLVGVVLIVAASVVVTNPSWIRP